MRALPNRSPAELPVPDTIKFINSNLNKELLSKQLDAELAPIPPAGLTAPFSRSKKETSLDAQKVKTGTTGSSVFTRTASALKENLNPYTGAPIPAPDGSPSVVTGGLAKAD